MTFTSGGTGGHLNINSATALGVGTFTINSGTTLDNTSGGSITVSNISGIHWNGNFTFAGANNLDFGTIPITMSSSHTVTLSAGTLSFGGVISGVGAKLSIAGTGALILSGANTYTGGVGVNSGTLDINNASALGVGGTFTIHGGTIDNTSGGAITVSTANPMSWSADFAFAGTEPLDLGSGTVTIGTTRTVTVSASTLTVDGAISSTHWLAKGGNGALALTAASGAFTGGVTLNAGTLDINNAAAIGTGRLTINGGTIDNTSGGAITTGNNAQTWNTSFTFTGTNALNLGTGAVTLGANCTVTTSASTLTVGGIISGTGISLTKAGAGTLVLFGSNSFSGGTTLSAGTLDINSAAAIGTGTFTINGGTIDNTSGHAVTLSTNNAQAWEGSFSFAGSNDLNLGTGAVTLGAGGIVVDTYISNLTVGGNIGDGSNGYGITEAGDGTGYLTLSGSSTFSGGVTLEAGQLDINSGGAIGTGTLTIDAGTSIDNTSGSPVTLSNNNTQAWNGDFTFIGSNPLNLGTGTVTLGASRNLTIEASTLTVGGVIGDGGHAYGITQAGAGTLVLNGADTYSGTTTIDGGVVQLGNANAAQNSTVSVGTTNGLGFSAGIGSFTIGGLAGGSNEALTDTAAGAVTLTVGNNGSANTYTGVLSGSGS